MSKGGDIPEHQDLSKCPPNIECNREYNTRTKEQYASLNMRDLDLQKEIAIIDRKRRANKLELRDALSLHQILHYDLICEIAEEERRYAERVLEEIYYSNDSKLIPSMRDILGVNLLLFIKEDIWHGEI